jgi:hypothetical protein
MNLDLFLVFQHRRTLAIGQPTEIPQTSFRTDCGDQKLSHYILCLTCDDLPKNGSVEEESSHFSHEERFFWEPEHML